MPTEDPASSTTETEVRHCYRCGADLPPGALHCPRCGRAQYYVCRCGNRNLRDVKVCPVCGMQVRLRRERRKLRDKLEPSTLAKYVVSGIAITLLLAMVFNAVVTDLAHQALPPGETLPESFSQRVALASQAFSGGVGEWGNKLARLLVSALPLLAAILVGALAGAITYFAHKGFLPFQRPRSRRHSDRHRRT